MNKIVVPREKISICSQAGKKIILIGSTSKCPDSKKTKTLCKNVIISHKGSEYFRNCEGISNSFSFSTPATAVAKGNSSQSKRKICSGREDWKSLEKGCNRKSSYEKGFCKKSVCEQFISSQEKGWGKQACHQFEENPPPPLQNGDPAIIAGYPQAGRLHVQIGSIKDIYFCIPFAESKKFVRYNWEGDYNNSCVYTLDLLQPLTFSPNY